MTGRPEYWTADDDALDAMVNGQGINQLTASSTLWGHRSTDPVTAHGAPLPPAYPAPAAAHSSWVTAWVRHLVRVRLGRVLTWVTGGVA